MGGLGGVPLELLGGVARELNQSCSGAGHWLLGSCSGELLGGAARELLGGVAREVSQGCSGVEPGLLGRLSGELLGSCPRVDPGLLGS